MAIRPKNTDTIQYEKNDAVKYAAVEPIDVNYLSPFFVTKSDLFLALDIHVRYMTDPISVIKPFSPKLLVSGSEILFDGFTVSTDDHLHDQYNLMAAGRWVYAFEPSGQSPQMISGHDVLDLVATFVSRHDYKALAAPMSPEQRIRAFHILVEALGLTSSETVQKSVCPKGWKKIRSSYSAMEHDIWEIAPKLPGWRNEIRIYRNIVGMKCSFVIYYNVGLNGEIPVYITPIYNKKTKRCIWLPVFPEKPLILYNNYAIRLSGRKEIVFCPDEKMADECCESQSLGTAVPGGMKNLLDADLESLRGRKVRMLLTLEDLRLGRLLWGALRKAGVVDPEFSVLSNSDVGGRKQCPKKYLFNELERAAKQHGVDLRVSTSGEKSVVRPVISRPGEPIPGSDVKLRTILDPIIHGGDLVWLYGNRNWSRTGLTLAVAHAVAVESGEVGKWCSPEKWGVLYVDGEMNPPFLRQRIDEILVGQGLSPGKPSFTILSAKNQDDGFIDIGSDGWQKAIEQKLRQNHLLILDDIQSLTDNVQQKITKIRSWFRRITSKGIAVLVIDRANHQGCLQGSSKRGLNADLCISLSVMEGVGFGKSGEDAGEGEPTRIQVSFPDGARELHRDQIAPFFLERRVADGGVTFNLVSDREFSVENSGEVRRQKETRRIKRMAAVYVLRENKKPPENFAEIGRLLGWSTGTVNEDRKRVDSLVDSEKTDFAGYVDELTQRQSDAIPPTEWGIEPGRRRSNRRR